MEPRMLAWANVVFSCHDRDMDLLEQACEMFVDTHDDPRSGWLSLAGAMAAFIASLTGNSTAMRVSDEISGGIVDDPDALSPDVLPAVTALRMITAAGAGDHPADHLLALESRLDPGQTGRPVGEVVAVLAQILHGVLVDRAARVAAGEFVDEPTIAAPRFDR